MRYRAIVRDADRRRLGTLPFLSLQAVLKDRAVGTWQLTMDARHAKASLIAPGRGLLLVPEDRPFDGQADMSGPITLIERNGEGDSKRTLTVAGLDDNFALQARQAYPDPTRTFEQQTISVEADADAYDVRSGPGETVLKQLVNLNAGPGAVPARRWAGLTVEADAGLGATVESTARFDVLIAHLAKLATAAGLTFRVIQVGTDLEFQVWQPTDRSAAARLAFGLGNLGGFTYSLAAPQVTATGVAGSGELEDRAFVERVNTEAEAEWGMRLEGFLDQRSTDVAAELEQAGDTNNVQSGPQASLLLPARDIPAMRFGRDYFLGDVVTVDVDGTTTTEAVRQVTITADANGASTAPLVGTDGASAEPADLRRIRNLTQRLDAVERRS